MEDLFDTPEKIEAAKSNFRTLMEQPGWKLFVQIAEANIEFLKEQLENGTGEEEETKASIDRIRDKLKITKDMINTPQNLIKKWESGEDEEPNPDPYETVDDLKRARGEIVEPQTS